MQAPQVWPAAPELRGLVDLAYSLRVRAGATAVLPDARAALVWLGDGTVRVYGPQTRPWQAPRIGLDVVGVRFALGAAPVLLGVSARRLTDRRPHLQELWGPEASELAARVTRAPAVRDKAALLQDAVRLRLQGAEVDPVARHLARRLSRRGVPVRELAVEVGLSERQLRRRCEAAFGCTPALLARLLRLHRARGRAVRRPGGAGRGGRLRGPGPPGPRDPGVHGAQPVGPAPAGCPIRSRRGEPPSLACRP